MMNKLKKLYRKFGHLTFVKKLLVNIIRGVLLIGLCFIIIYPLLQLFSLVFMDLGDANNPRIIWIPKNLTLTNVKLAIKILDYPKSLATTFVFSLIIMVMQTIVCGLAGYGFARLKFRGSNLLFIGVIATILVPPQTIILPMYLNFKEFDILGVFTLFTGSKVNLLNSPWSMFILAMTGMGIKSGLYIYIFRQFFKGLPKALEEAALIDGAGVIKTFFHIMVPCAKSPAITVMLFSFVWQWNDTFFSSLFYGKGNLLSLKLGKLGTHIKGALQSVLKIVVGDDMKISPVLESLVANAAILMVVLPLLILYLFAQKQFVTGIEKSGIKG